MWPILGDVAGGGGGVGLDFCLSSWEKCIIYWHYFANYYNAIFITTLNNKPKIFVAEEDDICLLSCRTPKHSQLPLVLPWKFITEWTAPKSSLSLSSLPSPFPVLNFQQRIKSLLSLRHWWTITPSSSLMCPHGHSSPVVGGNGPLHPTSRIRPVPVWISFKALQHRNTMWICSHWDGIIRGLQASLGGRTGLMDAPSLLCSLQHMKPSLGDTLTTKMWEEAEEA